MGKLEIISSFKNNRSYLKESYSSHPFKVADVTEDKTTGNLELMIMSSSPGVLDNDKYAIHINIEACSSLHLTTQAYQRLFSMKNHAHQEMNIYLGNDASFVYLPHPTVPHKGCSFKGINQVYLQPRHNLLWSEITTCGRKLCGEAFNFTSYHSMTAVYASEKLVVKENILMRGDNSALQQTGNMEGFTHQSSLLWLNDSAAIIPAIDRCRELLSQYDDVIAGVSQLPVNGLIIRVLGNSGEQLFNINNKLAHLLQVYKHAPVINNPMM
jgi:urease accessory protein